MDRQFNFLVVDSDEAFRELCSRFLTSMGHKTAVARDGHEALSMLRREWFDVALVDLRLPKLDGLQLVKIIKAEKPSPEVVILTGYGSISSAIEAMKLGAYDYATKPFQHHEMELVINRLLRTKRLESENRMLKKRLDKIFRMESASGTIIGTPEEVHGFIVGSTEGMKAVFESIAEFSRSRTALLIQGESGTGKELVARAIHMQGADAEKPFVVVECSNLSSALLESRLFGHVKGAFQGAMMSTPGAFVEADGGTLYLDEVCDVPFEIQERILEILKTKEVTPLGATQSESADVRLIAATEWDPIEAAAEGRLREDFLRKLNGSIVRIPSLRERRKDIPHLLRHFVQKYAREYDVAAKEVSAEAMELLLAHEWPGNVRELESAVARAFAVGETDAITVDDLPPTVRGKGGIQWRLSGKPVPSLEEAERSLIELALEAAKGKKAVAARFLEIDRQRLYRKIKKYRLDPNLGKK